MNWAARTFFDLTTSTVLALSLQRVHLTPQELWELEDARVQGGA